MFKTENKRKRRFSPLVKKYKDFKIKTANGNGLTIETKGGKTEYENDALEEVTEITKANLVCSDLLNGSHMPAIDIDYPCVLIPSQTPGHYHLYINKEVPTDKYMELLRIMSECGIVESGYYFASLARGYSSLRLPAMKYLFENYSESDDILDFDPFSIV